MSTCPDAARVEIAFGLPSFSVGKRRQRVRPAVGQARARSCGPAARPGRDSPRAQASNAGCHAACASRPRATTSRAWASTSGATKKCSSGSKPRIFLVLRISSSPSAEPCAAPVFCLVGAGQPMMVRTAMKDGRCVSACAAAMRLLERDDVLTRVDPLGVPAVGLVAGQDVLAERDGGVVLDRDVVVVVEDDQVAQLLVSGERRGLARDAFLHAAVADDDVDVVVEQRCAGRGVGVEQPALAPSRHRHADAVGDALAERAGGRPRCRGCGRARGGPGSASPRCAAPRGRRARGRTRTGTAGSTGSATSARWTG